MSQAGYGRMSRNDLVARANALLRQVGKPGFSNVDELRSSACSMFVYLYEKLFKANLEGVVRRPALKSDYVANAEAVLNALADLKQEDLNDISGTEIANGNTDHISMLLEEFENLSQGVNDEHELWRGYGDADSEASNELDDLNLHRRQAGRIQPRNDIYYEEEKDDDAAYYDEMDSSVSYGGEEDDYLAPIGGVYHQYGPSRRDQFDTASSEDDNLSAVDQEYARRLGYPSSEYSENSSQPSSVSANLDQRPYGGFETRTSRYLGMDDYRADGNDYRHGDDVFEDMIDRFPQHKLRRRKELDAIRSLARHRNDIANRNEYSGMLASQKERDKNRFRQAYQNILEEERREDALREQRRRMVSRLEMRRLEHEKKVERARLKRLAQDLAREAESRRQRRRDREDALVKSMFDDAIAMEKERALRAAVLAAEEQARADREALSKYEAARKVYEDQKDMLNERLREQENMEKVQKKNRQEQLRRLSKELKQDFEKKLQQARVALDAQESKVYQINAQVIEKAFALLNDTRAEFYQATSAAEM